MTLPNEKVTGVTKAELIMMVNQAAEEGAAKALGRIGLHDENAIHDVKELRDLLDSWRETKKSIRSTVVKTVTIAVLGFLVGASALKIREWL